MKIIAICSLNKLLLSRMQCHTLDQWSSLLLFPQIHAHKDNVRHVDSLKQSFSFFNKKIRNKVHQQQRQHSSNNCRTRAFLSSRYPSFTMKPECCTHPFGACFINSSKLLQTSKRKCKLNSSKSDMYN